MSKEATAYMVWQVDCAACGFVGSYGEDISTVPLSCDECEADVVLS